MKVKFNLSIGYRNVNMEEIFDTEKDFNLTDQEWRDLSDEEKYEYISIWANTFIEFYIEELEE